MAAVLACGDGARLSHRSAAELWRIWRGKVPAEIEVTIPSRRVSRRPGIKVTRRDLDREPPRLIDGIPVTDPVSTLIDLASCASRGQLENSIGEADHRDLVDPESLFEALDPSSRRPGQRRLWTLLDRQRTRLAASELERRLLRIVDEGGLPMPDSQIRLGPHRVDFYWEELGLVVEADSLRYHRTPARQSADMRRDHAHASAGRTTLRFSHADVRHDPHYVLGVLRANIKRLQAGRGGKWPP